MIALKNSLNATNFLNFLKITVYVEDFLNILCGRTKLLYHVVTRSNCPQKYSACYTFLEIGHQASNYRKQIRVRCCRTQLLHHALSSLHLVRPHTDNCRKLPSSPLKMQNLAFPPFWRTRSDRIAIMQCCHAHITT